MGKEHPVIASVVGEIDGLRVLRFEGEGVESYATLSEEQAQKLGRELVGESDVVVWRPNPDKLDALIAAFNEVDELLGAASPGTRLQAVRLSEAIQALRTVAVSAEEAADEPAQLPEILLEAFPVSAGDDPHPLTQSRMRGLMEASLEDVYFNTFMRDLIPSRPVSLYGLLYAAWIGGARSGSVRGMCYEGDWPESS